MADVDYDSIKLINRLNDIFYKLIIPFNKRNTKDKNKTLTNEEKTYKLIITIENTFLKIKKNRRLEIVYEKKSKKFLSLIYLSLIKFII